MWKLIFLVLLWMYQINICALDHSDKRCRCGTSDVPAPSGGRIVGGVPATPHEFPWQAALLFNDRPYCGGCLFNSRYVITAAHCVKHKLNVGESDLHVVTEIISLSPRAITVLLGDHNYRDPTKRHFYFKILKIVIHPRYNSRLFENDLALIKLRTAVNFNSIMKPPCFPRPDLNYTGTMAFVAGWGRLREGKSGPTSSILHKTNLPIISIYRCRKAFGANMIQSSFVCAGWKVGRKDACLGDSGSALVTNRKGRWHLVGLVSWGIGCGRPKYPGVYTRVDKYYTWLDKHTKDATFCTY